MFRAKGFRRFIYFETQIVRQRCIERHRVEKNYCYRAPRRTQYITPMLSLRVYLRYSVASHLCFRDLHSGEQQNNGLFYLKYLPEVPLERVLWVHPHPLKSSNRSLTPSLSFGYTLRQTVPVFWANLHLFLFFIIKFFFWNAKTVATLLKQLYLNV